VSQVLSFCTDLTGCSVGATLVPEGSWVDAPTDHIIIGLKELPVEDCKFLSPTISIDIVVNPFYIDKVPLKHTHVQFAHCYKNQGGWEDVLSRFARGNGTLLDLEFLTDEAGRRVAAFGYHAGFAGSALAIQTWAWQLAHPIDEPLPSVSSYANEGLLIEDVKKWLAEGSKKTGGKLPQVLVIGALGRCGKGAVDLCIKAGLPEANVLQWDLPETAKGGPFSEIVESDIFINCIYLASHIPPFVDMKSLESPSRKLSVVCDVSCDTTNPYNPIPIYTINTTFANPTVSVKVENPPRLSVISIDHLPSLLPREASEAFSSALLPSLLQLKDRKKSRVWQQAEQLFNEKVAILPK
jgi:saccharopine dehydrogenase (NAD+, L-lysine forming)